MLRICWRFFCWSALFFQISFLSTSMANEEGSVRKTTSLNGRHLLIIPLSAHPEVRFNDSAKLQENMPRTDKVEIDIINWLARRYNFVYSVCKSNEMFLEPSSAGKGAMSSLLDNTCDIIVSNLLLTYRRFQLIDMPYPFTQGPLYFVIPVFDDRANIAAILKPFQMPVWILFTIAVVVVILALRGFRHFILSKKTADKGQITKKERNDYFHLYVVGMLLYQGGRIKSKRLAIRVVAGAWCLVALILGLAYTSTLITYVISPNNPPLVDSIYDVAENPNIHVMVEKDWGIDSFFSNVRDKDGIYAQIRDRINYYPDSRCKDDSEVFQRVSSGGLNIFPQPRDFIYNHMLKDFQKTGKCRLNFCKKGFMNTMATFGLTKGSVYTKTLSDGVIEMNAFGLIEHWMAVNRAHPHQCLKKLSQKQSTNPRLSLKNLTGAFVVLLVGWGVSILIFLVEQLSVVILKRFRGNVINSEDL